MANTKIENLGELTAPISTDILPIVDDPGVTPITKKVTIANLLAVYDGQTATLTGKSIVASQLTGIIADARMPNLTGDITTTEGAVDTTIGADKVLLSMIAPAAKTECMSMAVSDNTTALEVGTVFTFYMPYAMTLTDIKASVLTAPTGAGLIVDVHDSGTTIMATDKLDIDVSEFHTSTAGTQPVLTDTALANNAKIEIIVDQVGSTVAGAGLVIYLIGYQT